MTSVLTDVSFCHLVVGVTDMDRALAFYRDRGVRLQMGPVEWAHSPGIDKR